MCEVPLLDERVDICRVDVAGGVEHGHGAARVVRLGDAPAELVDGAAARDREDPGQHAGAVGVVGLGALPHFEEHLLLDVLRRRAISQDLQQQAERRGAEARVHVAQGVALPVPEALREPALVASRWGGVTCHAGANTAGWEPNRRAIRELERHLTMRTQPAGLPDASIDQPTRRPRP